jgi:predicted amidohydrolase YtcJ
MAGSLFIDNARIWTGDPRLRPRNVWRRSLLVVDGRIVSFDLDSPPAGVEVIDAGGRVITPGLIDAHMHLVLGAKARAELDLSHVKSREEFERAIAQRHRELPPGPGNWLIARGWSSENWLPSIDPDKTWLRAAGDRPCVCHRMDHHAALVNDAVMCQCGPLVDDPPGGRIIRTPGGRGEPTGLFVEAAAWKMILPLIPEPETSELQRATLNAAHHLAALGLTSVGSMEYGRTVERVLVPIAEELPLRVQVTLLDRDWPIDFTFAHSFEPVGKLDIIGFKTFIDGTLGSRTARMLEEYADDPGNRGMLVELAGEGKLEAWARLVAGEGFSPSMHAIGDEAARLALDALDALGADFRGRGRIEHAQQLNIDDIPRFRGRIASMQPLHKADDCRYVEKRVGKQRIPGAFAFRSLHDAGAVLAFGSDWPIVSPDPIAGMRVAITGRLNDGTIFAPQQNLTVEETLTAYTRYAAFALGLDNAGVLREGAAGDFTMFDGDPFAADWMNNPPRVVMTVCDGNVTFEGKKIHHREHREHRVGVDGK